MKTKFFSGLIFFVVASSSISYAATTVTVFDKEGAKQEYKVEESGKLYFSDNSLMIATKAGSNASSVNVADIRKITFASDLTGVENNAAQTIEFFAFPNPVKDVVFIAGVKTGEKVSVFNANGALVKEISYNEEGIDLSSLPTGAYVLSVAGKSAKINKL